VGAVEMALGILGARVLPTNMHVQQVWILPLRRLRQIKTGVATPEGRTTVAGHFSATPSHPGVTGGRCWHTTPPVLSLPGLEIDVSIQLPPVLGLPGLGVETDVSVQLPPVLGLPGAGLETGVSVNLPPVLGLPGLGVDTDVSVQLPPVLGLPGVGLETDVSVQLPPVLSLPGLETAVSLDIPSAGLSELGLDTSVSVGLPAGGAETGLGLNTNIEFAGDSILSSVSLEAAAFELNAQLDVRAGAGSLPLLDSIADASENLTSLDPLPALGSTLLNHDPNLTQESPSLTGLENSFGLGDLLGPELAGDLDPQLASSALRDIGLQVEMIMPPTGPGEVVTTQNTTSEATIIPVAANLAALQSDGLVSSGEIFDFTPSPLNAGGGAQLNELFVGTTYTDYNVALQELTPSEVTPTTTTEADTELQHITLQEIADDAVELPTLSNPVEPLFSVSPEELSIRAISI
jgi:hypothetical protein